MSGSSKINKAQSTQTSDKKSNKVSKPTGAIVDPFKINAGSTVVEQPRPESIIREISEISATAEAPKEQLKPMENGSYNADLIIIGAGPGGYVAAIRAAQLGAKVIVVEKEFLGGTCLNVGCIPSKVMIASVERLDQVKHADKLGVIVTGEVSMDFEAMMKRKTKIVELQKGGVATLFKKNGVQSEFGFARFLDNHTIEVEKDGQKKKLTAKNFILATGSSTIKLKIPGLEGGVNEGVWTSDDAVTAPYVPKRMLVLGGGAVGCEFSYVFNGLGSQVTLVEMMPSLLPLMDADIGTEIGKLLGRQGITVKVAAGLDKCERKGNSWICHIKKGTEIEKIEVDVVLLGVGRKTNIENMGLEQIGIQFNRRGIQIADDTLKTHVDNIYAIGDVTGRIQLAHMASAEGIMVVQNILTGTNKKMDYSAVPNCVYTNPEVASVGLSQSEAESQGYEVGIGKAFFRPFGKAMATGEQDGFVKIVFEKKYGQILGMHLIGAHVTEIIHEGVVALKLEATLDYMLETIHAHPTMSEAVMEAYEDAAGHAIHKM